VQTAAAADCRLQTGAAAASKCGGRGDGGGGGSGGGDGGGAGGGRGGGQRMVTLFATERALAELAGLAMPNPNPNPDPLTLTLTLALNQAGLAMLALSLALPDVDSFGALAGLSLLGVT